LAELKDTGESAYKKIVDKAAAEYKKFEDVDVSELATLAKDLKSQWKIFQSGAKKSISRTKRKVSGKKTVKKSAKKS
jgi:predicted RNA-binding protein with PIN domain